MTTFAILDVVRRKEVLDIFKPLEAYGKVLMFGETDSDALWTALPEIDVLLIRLYPVDKALLDRAVKLKAVIKAGVGVDHIDVDHATQLGVHVVISLGNHISVAETAIMLMLAVARDLPLKNKNIDQNGNVLGIELCEKTLGLVGAGRIGSHVAKIAGEGMGMKILVSDPYLSEDAKKAYGWTAVDLETLLRESDVVSIHCPATPETHHSINKERLLMMKKNAILVNTSRGSIIDEAALVDVLKAGHLKGAGLDVVEREPLTADNPLLQLGNVIVTPHRLAQTPESTIRQAQSMFSSAVAITEGKIPGVSVNQKKISLEKNRLK